MPGDAVIMMADESDDCRDVVRYWEELNKGYDCVFGSRFVKGGGTIDYPRVKLVLNRLANYFLKALFAVRLNDTTNAFKAYRRESDRRLPAYHFSAFNLTVELPLKAIVAVFLESYSYHLAESPNGSRPSSRSARWAADICLSAFTYGEKYFSCGDYRKKNV
jgi:dolichol-phosphate mannosyltransferase